MKRRITGMVWKSQEWTRAAEQLRAKCWSLMLELSSAIANEETKIARMETGGRVKASPVAQSRGDKA
jgi:hypothetical protein